jgi:hypothetical protein
MLCHRGFFAGAKWAIAPARAGEGEEVRMKAALSIVVGVLPLYWVADNWVID